ncbi:TorF family putative porin [Shewanella sp. C32]|uniref:TorF family putative porin n=1 Tax=Shewanella electrica TaxID=515560 RepID=A0ABT2FQB7_9GAMM|nr:TorF family putative porin [Shewanella electrica]MCH1926007.1 TorF family putative porin [Shewanella electrica]MCS4557386.1 TorF family putative porin [Shewanella electrica]
MAVRGWRSLFALICCVLVTIIPGSFAQAKTSLTLSAYNDYLCSGISQTNKNPAVQANLSWMGDSGFHASAYASRVDFDGVNVEADITAGYFKQLTDALSYDVGVTQYSYFGTHGSDEFNYTEFYATMTYYYSTVIGYYTTDYAGAGARYYNVKFVQTAPLTDRLSLLAGIGYSKSLDMDKWSRENRAGYSHWRAGAHYAVNGYQLSAEVQGTSLDHTGDTRLVFGISKTFDL